MRVWCLLLVIACSSTYAAPDPAKRAARIVDVTDASFHAEVEQAKSLVLVEFSAEWCGPCRMLEPVLKNLAVRYAGRVKICTIDVSEETDNPQLARRFDPEPLPCLVLFKNGREVERRTGAGPNAQAAAATLRQWLDRNLAK
jgi:thioredoxin 1